MRLHETQHYSHLSIDFRGMVCFEGCVKTPVGKYIKN